MTETHIGRYWRARRLGWLVNVDIHFSDMWITMENSRDYWRPTERMARRLALKLSSSNAVE
ncbi:MAG: hypothetical protein ACXVXO_12520 [Mycobacteriaceae bacterium]